MPALIDASTLRAGAGDHDTALLEIGYGPRRPGSTAVLPGARRVEWRDLLWDERERRLATPRQLACRLGGLRIARGATLVVYGEPVQFGAYAAWALEVSGHPDVRLLDGGKEAWLAAGLPLGREPEPAPGACGAGAWFSPPATSTDRIDRGGVAEALGHPDWVFLDVRSREEYLGDRVSPPEFEVDHGAAVGGRLPGARHLPFRELLGDDGRFRPAGQIAERLREAGVDPQRSRIVTYCRLGHRAALAWFALRHVLGAPRVQVYDGSWTEWGSLVGAPVER